MLFKLRCHIGPVSQAGADEVLTKLRAARAISPSVGTETAYFAVEALDYVGALVEGKATLQRAFGRGTGFDCGPL
jgi:hypothetical protein